MAQGRRTVAAALRASGNAQASNGSLFHQVLNRARWSPLAVSRQLLVLIVETFVPAGACVDLVIDETLERRWGGQISTRGHSRDRMVSSKERKVEQPWVAVDRDGGRRHVALDKAALGLAVLVCTGDDPRSQRHKTIGMGAHQMVSLLRRWLPDRKIKLMGDTASTVLELGLHAKAQQVTLIPTGRLDAVLHEPAPERTQNTIGRPRVKGRRLPALDQVLQDPETVWQELTVDWYGQGKRQLQMCTGTALWDRSGDDPLPIRWVLTRDPVGKRPANAIFSPDPTRPAEESIMDFLKRWSLGVTFEESRVHLGIETQRQWSDLAIERSTPLLFGLSSLVALFGRSFHPDGQIPVVQAAWSRKQTAPFREVLAAVRRHLSNQGTFCTSPADPAVVVVPSSIFDTNPRPVVHPGLASLSPLRPAARCRSECGWV